MEKVPHKTRFSLNLGALFNVSPSSHKGTNETYTYGVGACRNARVRRTLSSSFLRGSHAVYIFGSIRLYTMNAAHERNNQTYEQIVRMYKAMASDSVYIMHWTHAMSRK
jgi:hypothetical protein